ncbi:hypothetical protein [Neoroseomonas lacus]|nr:hypothetical protein [Neoroseomonas lacus]
MIPACRFHAPPQEAPDTTPVLDPDAGQALLFRVRDVATEVPRSLR